MSAPGNPPDQDPSEPPDSDPDVPDPYVPDPEVPDYSPPDPNYPTDYSDEDMEYDDREGGGSFRRDVEIDAAKEFLTEDFFPRQPDRVFYSQQIQVLVEDAWAVKRLTREERPGFFHWITGKALLELGQEGKLESEVRPLGKYRPGASEAGTRTTGTKIHFYWSLKTRYVARAIARILKVVREFSAPEVSHAIGNNGEMMFDAALPKMGFLPRGENVREWNGLKWEKTGENLDRVFERDGIYYGVEIKNTLSYIPREELESKLEMCRFLGLVPLFIMRASPKNYNQLVIEGGGGYALIFRWQLYPQGQEQLVKKVRDTLGIPVDAPRAIALGTVERFLNWHRWKFRRDGQERESDV